MPVELNFYFRESQGRHLRLCWGCDVTSSLPGFRCCCIRSGSRWRAAVGQWAASPLGGHLGQVCPVGPHATLQSWLGRPSGPQTHSRTRGCGHVTQHLPAPRACLSAYSVHACTCTRVRVCVSGFYQEEDICKREICKAQAAADCALRLECL